MYCKNSNATAKSIEGYYKPKAFFDTPTILQKITKPVVVFIGSVDKVVSNLSTKMKQIKNKQIKTIIINGANHYFRDLYLEDIVDSIDNFRF